MSCGICFRLTRSFLKRASVAVPSPCPFIASLSSVCSFLTFREILVIRRCFFRFCFVFFLFPSLSSLGVCFLRFLLLLSRGNSFLSCYFWSIHLQLCSVRPILTCLGLSSTAVYYILQP